MLKLFSRKTRREKVDPHMDLSHYCLEPVRLGIVGTTCRLRKGHESIHYSWDVDLYSDGRRYCVQWNANDIHVHEYDNVIFGRGI